MASTRLTRYANACARRSGPASISTQVPASPRIRSEGRNRVSRGSSERQVRQSHPIIGTPCDVPVPRNVICKLIYLWLDDPPLALLRLHVAHAQFVQQIIDELRFVDGQV